MAETFDTIFYDGHCGLCHRWVKFTVLHDREGNFRFATRDTGHFRNSIAEEIRATLPPTILVFTRDGKIMMRSDATIYILTTLGGRWLKYAKLLKLFPRPIRDLGYRFIATIRHYIFAPPESVCPVVPEELRGRFLIYDEQP